MANLLLKTSVGGGGKVSIFEIDWTTGTETFMTTPTSAEYAHEFDRIESSESKGYSTTYDLVLTGKAVEDTEELELHLQHYFVTNPIKEITQDYENGDGSIVKKAVSNAKSFGFIWYGAEGPDSKVRVIVGLGVYSGDTGAVSQAKDQTVAHNIEITAVRTDVDIAIPVACFDSAKVTVAVPQTLSSGEVANITHETAA